MAAVAPCDAEAGVVGVASWVRLVLDAGLVQVVSASERAVCEGVGHRPAFPLVPVLNCKKPSPSPQAYLQMAQVSVQMAQLHIATALHFLISNRFPVRPLPAPAPPFEDPAAACSSSLAPASPTASICSSSLILPSLV